MSTPGKAPAPLRRIALLGSTGSIGTQALEVIRAHPDRFSVEVLTASANWKLLVEQAREFRPRAVVIAREALYNQVSEALAPLSIQVYAGEDSVAQIVNSTDIDLVLLALVGASGLHPAINALRAGKDLALANKESLVVGGRLLLAEARLTSSAILPVDSEHSAIFQCLAGESGASVQKVILTASGGPFRTFSMDELRGVTPEQALKHPNWSMGCKISVDSATLMNKGLEMIEAKWLFGLEPARIEVIVHPQSVIHSMVEFTDGSIKAQMGMPDMRGPIMYALSWPERLVSTFPGFSFADYPQLTFEPADPIRFRNLHLAYEAMKQEGNMPCIMNAANEIAVEAFLKRKIGFLDIPDTVEQVMQKVVYIASPGLDDLFGTDREARIRAMELIN
ncbi:MAG: 1-deoxy-D-xylulose-5-phosphate reductoisomerase [Bacteroidales bacterium]|nr:1-deoxy-D-xylulose-5-phosphate reductoisomerase [Bacteroidales bacterium]